MMRAALTQAFNTEMAAAHHLFQAGEPDAAFVHLERAHVLGQRHVVPHVRVHWRMARIGLARRSAVEVVGQAVRIVFGVLGSAVGLVPTGNTGGDNISMFRRLPIDPVIADLMRDEENHG